MASLNDSKKKIILSEADIPGAVLPQETPELCNVVQLKRWLTCRGARTSGKKIELIARVRDYMKCGLDKRELRDPDGGVHLARKKAELGVLEEHTPHVTTSFPTEGFSESLLAVPLITFKTVWTYMVSCLDAKKQLSTAKPLIKGFNFYKSGHVLTLKSCNSENGARTYVKSHVLPSMKKSTSYLCYIIIRKNGLVQRAYCGCPAGIDGRCNHVAATLFCLEEFCKVRSKQGDTEEACTSQKCKWNVPRKRKVDLVPVGNLKFQKHEHGKVKKPRNTVIASGLDVRHAGLKDSTTERNTKLYNIYTKVMNFQDRTGKLIGLSHILQKHTTESLKEIINLDHDYAKSPPVENKPHENDQELISPIKDHPVSLQKLTQRCEAVTRNIQLTEEEIEIVERKTRKQSESSEWFHHRKYRITASKAYRCASLRESTSPSKAVAEVLGYNNVKPTNAMTAGLSQEPVIIKEYVEEKVKNGVSVSVKDCGFFVSPTHGFLGASPDGVVNECTENCQSSGLIELKFIQTNASESIKDALLRKRICIICENDIKVNCKHQYFYQMQQQMYVTNKKWTDFVVKGSSCKSLYIERVEFDPEFWRNVFPKLKYFFDKYMLPEIVYPSIKYGQSRRVLDFNVAQRDI